jgi:hypothetical protein
MDGRYSYLHVLWSCFGAHGKRDYLATDVLCLRKIRIVQPQTTMFPHRFGPVYERLNAGEFEMLTELIALGSSNDIVLKNIVERSIRVVRQLQIGDFSEAAAIKVCDLTAVFDPLREVHEFDV